MYAISLLTDWAEVLKFINAHQQCEDSCNEAVFLSTPEII